MEFLFFILMIKSQSLNKIIHSKQTNMADSYF